MIIEAPESRHPDRAFFYASQQFFLTYQHFVFLYERYGPAPFIINTLLMTGLLVYAFRSTALKNADPKPASRGRDP